MPLINHTDILANDYNFTPLPKTWYHHESDYIAWDTFRFSKRSDHTGVLIRIDNAEFYEAQQ